MTPKVIALQGKREAVRTERECQFQGAGRLLSQGLIADEARMIRGSHT